MKHTPMKEGEEYLSVVIWGSTRLTLFPVRNKTNIREPDFRGEGVSVWVRQKKKATRPKQKPNPLHDEFEKLIDKQEQEEMAM